MSSFANLVPATGSLASIFNSWFFSSPYAFYLMVLVMLVIASLSYVAHQLTLRGSLAMFLVGFGTTWILGFGALATLMLFFVAAGVLGKLAKRILVHDPLKIQKKGGCRDAMQVFANGLMALIAALLYATNPSPMFLVMFGAAVGEAASDTFAGDVGILSKNKPVSIITGKPMTPGLSGAVSPLGFLAGLLGSVIIALFFWGCFLPVSAKSASYASIVAIGAFFGCLLDSVLGATVQAHYYDEVHDWLTEHEIVDGRHLDLARGIRWMDNDMVNLVSNVTAAVLAGALTLIVG